MYVYEYVCIYVQMHTNILIYANTYRERERENKKED